MATIFDYISSKEQARRWEESALERPPYFGEGITSTTKQLGTEFSTLNGRVSAPKILNASSYDAKAIYLPREGFQITKGEIPYFKNALSINEKQRQDLLIAIQSGNQEVIEALTTKLYNDNKTLLESAGVTREAMRMQLLTTGKIAISNNGQVWEFDFGVPAENQVDTDWGVEAQATADPVNDIISAQDAVETKYGVRPRNVLMNTVTFNKFSKLTNILNALNANSVRTIVPRKRDIVAYLEDATESTIYLYDKTYKGLDGKMNKFVPDDVVFPDGAVIEEVFGTTPEEADLMAGISRAQVSLVDTGVALTTWAEEDPVFVRTKVSMTYIPTLVDPNSIVIMDVKHEG